MKNQVLDDLVENYHQKMYYFKEGLTSFKYGLLNSGYFAGQLVQGIPLSFVPSELREKYYNLESKLVDKLGLYEPEEKEKVDTRNMGVYALGFIGCFTTMGAGLPDFIIRLMLSEAKTESWNNEGFIKSNLSNKYAPSYFPVEFAYSTIANPVKYLFKTYKNAKEKEIK